MAALGLLALVPLGCALAEAFGQGPMLPEALSMLACLVPLGAAGVALWVNLGQNLASRFK